MRAGGGGGGGEGVSGMPSAALRPVPASRAPPGAIYTLLALREPLAMCAPATLCLGLLLLLNVRGHAAPAKAKAE